MSLLFDRNSVFGNIFLNPKEKAANYSLENFSTEPTTRRKEIEEN